jgi:hypothetical protein
MRVGISMMLLLKRMGFAVLATKKVLDVIGTTQLMRFVTDINS